MSEPILPCPMCSSVSRNGVHRKANFHTPMWNYARNTSKTRGCDHWIWTGCEHARDVGPKKTTDVRETTEARWHTRARELLLQKTKDWTIEARGEFERELGYTPAPAKELKLE